MVSISCVVAMVCTDTPLGHVVDNYPDWRTWCLTRGHLPPVQVSDLSVCMCVENA